jgi:hypothetical protein
MTDTQRKRDPRYTRTVGEAPDLGRRYVENGKVKIEWYEDGKRRSRTIGDNDAKTRRKADEELEQMLGLTDAELAAEEVVEDLEEELEEACSGFDLSWLLDDVRCRAEALMDVADDLAESFERGLVRIIDWFRCDWSADEDAAEESECVEDSDEPVDAEVVEEIVEEEPKEPE